MSQYRTGNEHWFNYCKIQILGNKWLIYFGGGDLGDILFKGKVVLVPVMKA